MKRLLFRVILFAVLIQFSYVSVRLIASLNALAINAGSLHVGLLLSSQAFAPVFFSIACGRWIDYKGTHRPLIIGCLILLLSDLLPIFFPARVFGIAILYAACILNGLGYMFVVIGSQKLIGFLAESNHRTSAFSYLALGYSASGLISPLVAGFLIDHASHTMAFIAAFTVSSLGFVIFLVEKRTVPNILGKSIKREKDKSIWDLIKIKRVRNILLISALMSMAWDLQHFMFPVFGHSIGLTASEIGLMVSVFYAATFTIRVIIPWAENRITEWQFLTLSMLVGGFSYILFPAFSTMIPLLVVSFVLGMGIGCAQPNIMSLVYRETPENRVGEALGIRTTLINASHTILPTVFGTLTTLLGVASIFFAVGSVMALSTILTRKMDLATKKAVPSQTETTLRKHTTR